MLGKLNPGLSFQLQPAPFMNVEMQQNET
jgi:hypothetical protein